MNRSGKSRAILLFIVCVSVNAFAFTGTIRFSDNFYAAQKFFYAEAKQKFPKLSAEKAYPEIPIKGTASNEELKKIEALTDLFEARRLFLFEVQKYPEQLYPEMFAFLNGHPGLSVGAGNKAKQAALEKYFYPYFYVFSSDKHYSFNTEIKQNPCPLVFCLKDEKKNSFSITVSNTSKKTLEFNPIESPALNYLTVTGKKPVVLKAGASVTLKLSVDVQKLKKDSVFKVLNLVLSDPTQPKIKLIVPVVLLPSKEFLTLPPHAYDLTFSYGTFFKHISLQKEKASWPEPCPGSDCSGSRLYPLRSPERLLNEYKFGELCTIQYNVITSSNAIYNSKNNQLKYTFVERGNLEGAERNCYGAQPGTEVHCPPETPNNGKELYGSRKMEFKLFLPAGKVHELKMLLSYSDLPNQPQLTSELSWLQEKKLLVTITDQNDKEVFKEFVNKNPISLSKKSLTAGTYKVAVFPVTVDGKHTPSFNIQHLNHGERGRFDFSLTGTFNVLSSPASGK